MVPGETVPNISTGLHTKLVHIGLRRLKYTSGLDSGDPSNARAYRVSLKLEKFAPIFKPPTGLNLPVYTH